MKRKEEEERGRYGRDEIERINKNYYKRIRERRACITQRRNKARREDETHVTFSCISDLRIHEILRRNKKHTFIQQNLKRCC
jgi:CDP-diacylglycerol pyrophosphatase